MDWQLLLAFVAGIVAGLLWEPAQGRLPYAMCLQRLLAFVACLVVGLVGALAQVSCLLSSRCLPFWLAVVLGSSGGRHR